MFGFQKDSLKETMCLPVYVCLPGPGDKRRGLTIDQIIQIFPGYNRDTVKDCLRFLNGRVYCKNAKYWRKSKKGY